MNIFFKRGLLGIWTTGSSMSCWGRVRTSGPTGLGSRQSRARDLGYGLKD